MINNIADAQYLKLLNKILNEGIVREDRTGTGTKSIFGAYLEFDVSERIPLLTTKKINFNTPLIETLWMFVMGSTNITYLNDNNVNIWNQWADSNNDIGPMYGKQARAFQGYREVFDKETGAVFTEIDKIDQIQSVISSIKNNPYSRRHVITLWNPATVPVDALSFSDNIALGRNALAICHGPLMQFYVEGDKLSLLTNIRSNDFFIGNPFNLINHTLILYMIAQCTGYKPGMLKICIGDAHLYLNHIEQAQEQLSRPIDKDSPILRLDPSITNINDFRPEHFTLEGYDPYPFIKAPISI